MNCSHASVRLARRQASTSARELLEPTAQHTSVCCAERSTFFAVYVSTTTVSLSLVSLLAVSMRAWCASTLFVVCNSFRTKQSMKEKVRQAQVCVSYTHRKNSATLVVLVRNQEGSKTRETSVMLFVSDPS